MTMLPLPEHAQVVTIVAVLPERLNFLDMYRLVQAIAAHAIRLQQLGWERLEVCHQTTFPRHIFSHPQSHAIPAIQLLPLG